MKALNLYAVNDLRLDDIKMPVCKEDEVLVKVKYCGICGSDIPRVYTKGTYHFPTVIGHEFSGIVEFDPLNLLSNKKVAVFPLLPCFECDSCKKGNYASCSDYDYYGSRRDGGMAEYISVKRWNLVILDDNMSLAHGAMCEPVSVARHASMKLGDITGMNILISGAGPIGLIAAQWCKSFGAKDIFFVDIDERKIEFAKTMGFYKYNGENIDAAIEGTGASNAFAACLKALRAEGKITLMGNPSREITLSQNDYWYILRKELQLYGTWNSSYNDMVNDWKESVAAISKGDISLEPLITHKFRLEQYKEAFDLMFKREEFYNKVMFEID